MNTMMLICAATLASTATRTFGDLTFKGGQQREIDFTDLVPTGGAGIQMTSLGMTIKLNDGASSSDCVASPEVTATIPFATTQIPINKIFSGFGDETWYNPVVYQSTQLQQITFQTSVFSGTECDIKVTDLKITYESDGSTPPTTPTPASGSTPVTPNPTIDIEKAASLAVGLLLVIIIGSLCCVIIVIVIIVCIVKNITAKKQATFTTTDAYQPMNQMEQHGRV